MAACLSIGRPVGSLVKFGKKILIQPVRYRWKPPDKDAIIYPTFSERLSEWNTRYESPASHGINIGYDVKDVRKQLATNGKSRREKKKELESAARHRKLEVDLDAVKEVWLSESMPKHVSRTAEHYGIWHDMFDGAYFNPILPIEVNFEFNEELVTPVYCGNVIPASEASQAPSILYNSKEDSLWTLIMSSPDGNLEENKKELLHWAIGNIPGNKIDQGDQLCQYLPPFPPRGAGFLRYVFVLFKQNGKADYEELHKSLGRGSLRQRSFSMYEFYKARESDLTPAGLAFFQSEWDTSVTSVFHNVLDMKEPVFEFLQPAEYLPAQMQYPHKEPFNLYLDMYRDVKDLQEEVLKLKLSTVDPSKPPLPPLKYPNMDALPKNIPTWLRQKIQHQRLGQYHWKDLHQDRDT